MDLLWACYSGKGRPEYKLLLVLGKSNGKVVCLDADKLDDSDRQFLRSKSAYMDKLSLDEKVALIKEMKPHIIKNCKTIGEGNLRISKTYPITS